VEEPDVSRVVNIQPFIRFQVSEKVLPLAAKPFGNIILDPLDSTVVDTPEYETVSTVNRSAR
jgi:hypothetical protein